VILNGLAKGHLDDELLRQLEAARTSG